jgi:hypothetical protein
MVKGLRRALVLTVALVAGCPAPSTVATGPLDYNQFVCAAQPVLIRRCSYLGCHGNANHALRLYSLGKLRIGDPTTRDARSNTLLSADEVRLNFQSAVGLQSLLLSKPLAARFGGAEHHGVAVFPVYPAAAPENDPEWNALSDWVAGKKQPSPVDSACADLFTAMNLPPEAP